MAKKVLIILADGFEEIEAITPVDVLRRAGVEVTIAGLSGKTITGAHGVKFQTDVTFDEYKDLPDAIILPGGMPGAKNLGESPKVAGLVKKMNRQNKVVGAICAAPALALAPTGILNGKKATCYPGFEKNFPSSVAFSSDRVVVDGNIITSRGPGSALEFALELVEKLVSKEKAETLSEGMLVKG
ncbi:MAG: DJ-1/PfpI family protein [Candidatus Omnitrophica bacterium]|nr:DJ-1/PfpI family protein [Candidatus Omnitrophota bacterium]